MYFLIGLPGSGKSHWGRIWAESAHLPFVDMDEALEAAAGSTVEAIFEREGEAGFRTREASVLETLLAGSVPGTLVATGGGTPAFGTNLEQMKKAGTVVYLQAVPALLAQRIFPKTAHRPLFRNCKTAAAVIAVLAGLLAGRAAFYEAAHLLLPAENLSSTTFEKTIQCFTVRP